MERSGRHVLRATAACVLGALIGLAAWPAALHAAWTSHGPYGGRVVVLTVDPVTPTTLYAGGDGGIFKSVDGAATWTAARSGITDLRTVAIAIDPSNPQVLYAGSDSGGGVFRSADGGGSWIQAVNGLDFRTIASLAIDPQNPATVYAGTAFCCGVYKSANGGASWVSLRNGLPDATISALVVDPANPSTIYAGIQNGAVYKSVDGGASWASASTGLSGPPNISNTLYALAIDPASPATLYAGTGAAIYRTTDSGAHWTPINGNLAAQTVQSVAVGAAGTNAVYIGTLANGVYRTVDGGTTWTAVNTGLAQKSIAALAIDPQAPSRLYAGTEFGIFRTLDAAATWGAANVGLSNTAIQAVAVDPLNPATIYAGMRRNGVFKSVDGGNSWIPSSTGIPTIGGAIDVLSLAVDPAAPASVYAGTGSGVYKSVNGGASWTKSSTTVPGRVLALAIDPDTPSTVHAGTNGFGMYTSTDAGATWVADSAGLPERTVVYSLSVVRHQVLLVDPTKGAFMSSTIPGVPSQFTPMMPDPQLQYAYGVLYIPYTYDVVRVLLALRYYVTVGVETITGYTAILLKIPYLWIPWEPPEEFDDPPPGVSVGSCQPINGLVADPNIPGRFYAGADCGVFMGSDDGATVVLMNEGLPSKLQVLGLALTPAGDVLYAATTGGGVYVNRLNAAPAASYDGLWWNAPAGSESGWGVNLSHQGDTIFATWFTYGLDGKPWWLAVTANKTGPGTYSGDLFTTVGPPFSAVPFDPAVVVESTVGTATFTFSDNEHGTLAYTVNVATAAKSAVTQTKNIVRQQFGSLPTCIWGQQQDLAAATNYQGLWWRSPAGSESGWGINLTHQDDTIFATWFTYDAAGKPWWLAFVANRTAPGVYAGDVFTTTGPPFNAVPFDPATVVETTAGTATLTFADGNNAMFAYTVNGTAQGKPITRQVFAAPGTVCH